MLNHSIFLQNLKNYSINDAEYENHVILVTGAANGIGRTLTKYLSSHGTTVLMLDKDEVALNQLYDDILRDGHKEPVIIHQDLKAINQEIVDLLVNQTVEELGRIDGIVFCACEYGNNSPIEHYQLDAWSSTIKVNLYASFLIAKSFLPLLRKAKDSTMIFTTSSQVRKSTAYWGANAVTDKALYGLVQTIADETENDSIEVFSLDPGEVFTSYMKTNYPGRSLSQLPTTDDVIPAYCYLLSSKANSARSSGHHYYIKDDALYGYV